MTNNIGHQHFWACMFSGCDMRSDRKRQAKMLVAAAVFAAMALLGPRMLTEAEVNMRRSPPPPRTPPPLAPVVLPKSSFAGSTAGVRSPIVVDLFFDEGAMSGV